MKKILALFSCVFLLALVCLNACSADYNTFDASDYCTLSELHFEEEASNPSVYQAEHKIIVTLEELPDSVESLDSVTVSNIDMSSLAKLYLVESKFSEFPTDSSELDSLAEKVAISDKAIKEKSKIRIPKSQTVYVVIISESGKRAIWQIKFEIPGVVPEESSSSIADGESSSSTEKENSETSLELKFENALEVVTRGDSILVEFPQGTDLSSIKLESSEIPEGATISPDLSSIKDWSKPQKITVTAEDGTEKTWVVVVSRVLNAATDFQIAFEKQFKVNRSGDTIYLKLQNGETIENAIVDSWSISEGATISPNPDSVKSWEEYQTFEVIAENGDKKTWVLGLSIAEADEKVSSDKELLSISAEGELSEATIDASAKTIVLHLQSAEALVSVDLAVSISETASHNLVVEGLDLRTSKTFQITAEDMSSVEWTISADFPNVAPKIESISIGSGKVAGVIDEEKGTIFFNMDFNTDKDLRSLAVSALTLSEGAETSDIKVSSSYNFSKKLSVTVSNASGDSKTYTLQAGYQYPGSNFNSWISDAFGNKNDVDGWDNGNNDAIAKTKTLTVNENEEIVKMESVDAKIIGIGRFASGNMLVAYFNPKEVSTFKLTQYDDGNELIDFGRPFYARPAYVEFDVKYEGDGDSCDLYVLLENRSRTTNEGKNQYRTSSDVNTLVASAWYRATTVESTDDPDVVSITDAARSGYKTIRLKFKYGEPDAASPIYNSSVFSTSLLHSEGIDNHLVSTNKPEDFDVTHIRVVMASSAQGQLYKGTVGATLWCDEMRLIYE